MEKQITEIPVLKKNKETKPRIIIPETSCCSQPSNASACCTPSKTKEDNNGACCTQPEDGSVCCDK